MKPTEADQWLSRCLSHIPILVTWHFTRKSQISSYTLYRSKLNEIDTSLHRSRVLTQSTKTIHDQRDPSWKYKQMIFFTLPKQLHLSSLQEVITQTSESKLLHPSFSTLNIKTKKLSKHRRGGTSSKLLFINQLYY